MDQRAIELLFVMLRSAISKEQLTKEERELYSLELLNDLLKISVKHDVAHFVALGLKNNQLLSGEESVKFEKHILKAAYRYEQLAYEQDNLCAALEKAQIPFIPLKGAVIRKFYPEPWMRTSCDIDILIHREDLDKAILYLRENLKYEEKGRATHDVSLFSPTGIHVELHFDLVEEGRANNAIGVLGSVWENVFLKENKEYWYEMTDAFFYFYHVAHMAKHFETGGCGIRPFIDLWILNRLDGVDVDKREELLSQGGLLKFSSVSSDLSELWFGEKEADKLLIDMQEFLLSGGVYGSVDNKVALQQTKKGGKFGYILSRIFIPTAKLKRYYPILEKHPWLMPIMQVRRWFMLLRPDVAKMAKKEISANRALEGEKANEMGVFLKNIGL